MRHETLLKVIIAFFGITLIVLATFVYGNVQRSKQKTQTAQTNQNQTNNQAVNTNGSAASDAPKTSQSPATSAAPAPVTPTQPKTANIPTTGADSPVLPMTILSILVYLAYKSRVVVRAKSQRC